MKVFRESAICRAAMVFGWLSLLVWGLPRLAVGQQGAAPGLGSQEQGSQEMAYQEVTPWPTPAITAAGTPAGPWNFGQVAAVATTKSGHILVLHRGAHPIMEFSSDGTFVRSWGDGLISEGKVVQIAPRDRVAGGSGYTAVYGPAGCYACGGHSVRVDSQNPLGRSSCGSGDEPGKRPCDSRPGDAGHSSIRPESQNRPRSMAGAG